MKSRPLPRPVVLVPADNRMMGEHPFHLVGRKYIDGVRLAGALPLIVPTAQESELDELLNLADGVLLTGSPSNVHPSNFDEAVHDPALPLDLERDTWTLPLVPKVLARGMPLLAICRGTQEANVALGGSLHQAVQEVQPYHDHRGAAGASAAVVYGPAHPVTVMPGGVLDSLLERKTFVVNSVHGQAVNRLAPGLRVEARSPDGLIEAFSVAEAKGFNLCLQWHPEWQAAANPESTLLFQAFGRACKSYRARHRIRVG